MSKNLYKVFPTFLQNFSMRINILKISKNGSIFWKYRYVSIRIDIFDTTNVKKWLLKVKKSLFVIVITIHNIFFKVTTVIQYTPAFSPSILQLLFCGILLMEGLERSGLWQSSIRNLTWSEFAEFPIRVSKNPKITWGKVETVWGVYKNFNFSFFQKLSDDGGDMQLNTVVVQSQIIFRSGLFLFTCLFRVLKTSQ